MILAYPVVIAGAWCVSSFFQMALHRAFGHSVRSFISRGHVGEHHRRFAPSRFSVRSYPKEPDVSWTYAIPALALVGLFYTLLPVGLFLSAVGTMAFSAWVHLYLHKHYHLRHSWLERFRWFWRLRRAHYRHHVDQRTNFAVIDLYWDRLLGTYDKGRP